jgi:hypothetical protein
MAPADVPGGAERARSTDVRDDGRRTAAVPDGLGKGFRRRGLWSYRLGP